LAALAVVDTQLANVDNSPPDSSFFPPDDASAFFASPDALSSSVSVVVAAGLALADGAALSFACPGALITCTESSSDDEAGSAVGGRTTAGTGAPKDGGATDGVKVDGGGRTDGAAVDGGGPPRAADADADADADAEADAEADSVASSSDSESDSSRRRAGA